MPDTAADEASLAIAPQKPRKRWQHAPRIRPVLNGRLRSVTVFRLTVSIICLGVFFATQRWLAVLFDDQLAAVVVALTLAVTAVGVVKPALLTPDCRL